MPIFLALFGTVDLFDATRIELPPTLSDWQETSEEKSGFKLQLKLDGRNRHFKEALLTTPDGNDNDYFSDLLGLEGEDPGGESPDKAPQGDLYLFDCGYFSIDQYHRITDTENSFVTKLHGNIDPQPVCRRPVPEVAADPDRNAAGYSVLEDRLVRLGDDRTDGEGGNPGRWYRVLTVKVSTGEQIEVLTNLLWLEAEQICRLYKHRWSIEIMFRWLKDRMQLDRFISRDPTGVVRQTLPALIVWGLLAIFNERRRAVQSEKAVAEAPGGNAPGTVRPRSSVSAELGPACVEIRQTTSHYWMQEEISEVASIMLCKADGGLTETEVE